MMRTLTLKTFDYVIHYVIHLKNDQKFHLCILRENNSSPRTFNIFKHNLLPIIPNKRPI